MFMVLLLSWLLFQYIADVTGQFTAAPPTCPDDTLTFRCIVGDEYGVTIWKVNGSSDWCSLAHVSTGSDCCGPNGNNVFIATPGTEFGTSATSFTSTLSGTATSELNGTMVECFGPASNGSDPENRVGISSILIRGPPSVPTLSCVDLSEDVSGTVNVTVSWTLSGGDSADFYLISITTNAPQTPYGGLMNITNGSVTQHELTGFMVGYEYKITIHGVNCGDLVGRESEPLTIKPQVPAAPHNCNISLSYEQSSRGLLFVSSTWDAVPDPLDPDPVDPCPGISGDITLYQISYTGTVVVTENVNIAKCTAGRCSHTFEPPSNPPSSYDSVSVAAENVVGVGAARTCTTQIISTTNNLLTGEVVGVSSPADAQLQCMFLSGFTGSAHCTVQYGTDPTYMNLPYSAVSIETGTAGDSVSVVLRERLNSSTVYYYTVSAVSGNVTVNLRGKSTNCNVEDLGNVTQTEIEHPMCSSSVNIASISGVVVCYNGTTVGSEAVYVCNDGYNLIGNETRVCQGDGIWSGSIPQCIPEEGVSTWIIVVVTIIAVLFLRYVGIPAVTAVISYIWHNCKTKKGSCVTKCFGETRSDAMQSCCANLKCGTRSATTENDLPDGEIGTTATDEPDGDHWDYTATSTTGNCPEENENINGKSCCETDGSEEEVPDIEIQYVTPV